MEVILPFDPLEIASETEKIVVDKGKRKYYRVRATGFYGGIVTADAVGCCFLCAYCWNFGRNLHAEAAGEFVAAEEMAGKLLAMARRKGLYQVRISGAEPIIGLESFKHLLNILEVISKKAPWVKFILETNGLFLGYDQTFAKELAAFRRLAVRVSLKAGNKEKFEKVTGARADFFSYPWQALINLNEAGARFWPAVVVEFFTRQEISDLKNFLNRNHITVAIEEEELLYYPFVEKNLRERGCFLFEP